MAGRYIPPHMRGTSKPSTSSESPIKTPERNPGKGYSYDEVSNQFGCKAKLGTLNSAGQDDDTGSTKESLSFIIIFKDQHPEWPPKIFCKSHLHLPPSVPIPNIDEAAQTLASTDNSDATTAAVTNESQTNPGVKGDRSPIAIFSQIAMRPPMFLYDGARSIESITYLQPGSAELIKMLDMKFGPQRKERTPESWQSSLSMKWAIVEMGELEECKNPMVPLRKMKDEKSVNEMLQEMRVRTAKRGRQDLKKEMRR